MRAGIPAAVIAQRFHRVVAEMILTVAGWVGDEIGTRRVLLSGGVFAVMHNRVLPFPGVTKDRQARTLIPGE